MTNAQTHDDGQFQDWFAQNLVRDKGPDGARAATAQANGHVRAAIERAIAREKTARAPNACTDEFNRAALALAQEQNKRIPDNALPVTCASTIEMNAPAGHRASRAAPAVPDEGTGYLTLPGDLQAVGFAVWTGRDFGPERWYALLNSHDLPHPTRLNIWDRSDQWPDDTDDMDGDA